MCIVQTSSIEGELLVLVYKELDFSQQQFLLSQGTCQKVTWPVKPVNPQI